MYTCTYSNLILGSITNQTLAVSESDVRGSGTIALVVGDNLHTIILPDANTAVGCTQINSNGFAHNSRYG